MQTPSFCQVKFVVFILQWITIRLGWHQSERGSTLARRETGLKIAVRKVMGQRPNLKPFWQLNIFDDMWQTNAQFQLVPLHFWQDFVLNLPEMLKRKHLGKPHLFKSWHSTREPWDPKTNIFGDPTAKLTTSIDHFAIVFGSKHTNKTYV